MKTEVSPAIITQLLDAITPAEGESLAQAVARIKAERTAERLTKTEELSALLQKFQDASPDVAVALGQAPASTRDEARKADLEYEIARITSAEAALTAAEHVARHRDGVRRVEALLGDYKMAVRGFATALGKAKGMYAPADDIAQRLQNELNALMIHEIGVGHAAGALLRSPLDSSRLALTGQWRETFGTNVANSTKASRWLTEFEAWLGQ